MAALGGQGQFRIGIYVFVIGFLARPTDRPRLAASVSDHQSKPKRPRKIVCRGRIRVETGNARSGVRFLGKRTVPISRSAWTAGLAGFFREMGMQGRQGWVKWTRWTRAPMRVWQAT